METEKCPHCGASVKKKNLRAHYEQVHPRKIDSLIRAKKEPVAKAGHVSRSHRKRNILTVSVIMLGVVGVYFLLLTGLPALGPPTPGTYPGPAAAGTMAEFNYLSQMHTDACHWPGVNLGDQMANVNWINSLPDNTYLQGACCSPMDYQADYASQIPRLQNYSSISIIAPDPYNLPAHIAKADVAFIGVALTPDQQSTLDSAASMTDDHGWCCCQCWAYYAHEGLAKALITQHGYDAKQVAAVLDLEDCCGGPGPMSM